MNNEFIPRYSTCSETGLRVCEIVEHLLVREDGMVKNIHPRNCRSTLGWYSGTYGGVRGGYRQIKVNYKRYNIHRLVAQAFLPNYSEALEVDHIDINSANNRVTNLRMVTRRQNNQNKKIHKDGKLLGASWHKRNKSWSASIRINRVNKYLGTFPTEQEAHEAYMSALRTLQE